MRLRFRYRLFLICKNMSFKSKGNNVFKPQRVAKGLDMTIKA